jgi:hypothetical protein
MFGFRSATRACRLGAWLATSLILDVFTTVFLICNKNYYKSFQALFHRGTDIFGHVSGRLFMFLPHCFHFATKIITKMLAAVRPLH